VLKLARDLLCCSHLWRPVPRGLDGTKEDGKKGECRSAKRRDSVRARKGCCTPCWPLPSHYTRARVADHISISARFTVVGEARGDTARLMVLRGGGCARIRPLCGTRWRVVTGR